MEIITGLTVAEGLFTHTLYDAAKKILKKDPIRSAIDKAIDELIKEKPNDLFVLEEIDRNRKEIFDNINVTEENTFLKILIDNGVLPETALRLYKNFSEKFNENIQEAAKKEPKVFFSYAIGEFEKNKKYKEELIELLTKFALEINATLERIIEEIKELRKISINIPEIKSVLRKEEAFEGEFFRKEPVWVDYEQGFIVERKEVDEIIKKLENNKIQLVLGAPASGKSIILKNVGFKLANQNKVYVVELKKHPQDEIKLFFENILKIDDDNPIFIIDDAHLNISECERLIRNFKARGKGKLIIGSRETREITEEHPKESAEYELLSELSKTGIHVHAEDVSERMIRTFLKQQYQFDKNRIQTLSGKLDKYKNDLWFLSWALKAYNKNKDSVNIDEIYEKIASTIEKIKVGKEKEVINAEDIFLPLSIFYRHEIPIERYFLEEQFGIDRNIINQLIGLQEIVETKNSGHKMLSLHHSSIAELYFGAYLRESDLGRKIKKIILYGKDENEENLEYCSFYKYLTTTNPRNSIYIVNYLGKYWMSEKKVTLLEKMTKEGKIQEIIEKGIEKEEDIEQIGLCARFIAIHSKEVALRLIDLDSISEKIKKEEDIEKIGKCLFDIALVSEEIALRLIDLDSISEKIKKEEDIEKIGKCLFDIALVSEEIALRLIDLDSISEKIENEKDIEKILRLLVVDGWDVTISIASWSKEVALELAEQVADSISGKIEKEEDKMKIERCLRDVSQANKGTAAEIINRLNPKLRDELHKRIPYLKIKDS